MSFTTTASQDLGNNIALRGMSDTDTHLCQVLPGIFELCLHFLAKCFDTPRIFDCDLTLFCQNQTSLAANKQCSTQLGFQLTDVMAHCRLGQRKHSRCLRKTLLLHNCQ